MRECKLALSESFKSLPGVCSAGTVAQWTYIGILAVGGVYSGGKVIRGDKK